MTTRRGFFGALAAAVAGKAAEAKVPSWDDKAITFTPKWDDTPLVYGAHDFRVPIKDKIMDVYVNGIKYEKFDEDNDS